MTYNKLVAVALLGASIALAGMEIKNWDYKERDRGYTGYFLPKQEHPKKYPYFLPEKDSSESNRSFSDELLFAQRMSEKGLPKDITDQILYQAYLTEKTLDQQKMYELKERFKVNKTDFLCLPMKSKRALAYVLEHKNHHDQTYYHKMVIEGRDKEFAQKMSQYILDLPLSIRKEIAWNAGGYMMCNTKYEPSIYNTLLGEDDNECHVNKPRLAKLAKIATTGMLTLGGIGLLTKVNLPDSSFDLVLGATVGTGMCTINSSIAINNKLSTQEQTKTNIEIFGVAAPIPGSLGPIINGVRCQANKQETIQTAAAHSTGILTGVVVGECASLYVSDKVEKFLEENREERDMRLGFEKIFLLKDGEK